MGKRTTRLFNSLRFFSASRDFAIIPFIETIFFCFVSRNFNSYGDTLNRNNLTMAQNNTFSTLGRNRPNQQQQHNNYVNQSSRNDLGLANNNNHNTLNRNHRYHADLPITNPIFKR